MKTTATVATATTEHGYCSICGRETIDNDTRCTRHSDFARSTHNVTVSFLMFNKETIYDREELLSTITDATAPIKIVTRTTTYAQKFI